MEISDRGIPREDLGKFCGITIWRETFPGSGRYLPAEPLSKSSANWPQAFMVAAMFAGFAAIIWAIAWAVR